MKKIFCLFILFSFLLSSCSTLTVKSDYDPDIDFSQYKTYKWYDGKPLPDDELEKVPLVKKSFIESVDKVMKSKGFTLDESDADIVLVIHAGVKEKMNVTDWGSYGWYDPWWGPYGGRVDVSYYDEGTLVIDFVDAEKKELVWRGLGTGIVRGYSDPEDRQKTTDEVALKILQQYPPKKYNN